MTRIVFMGTPEFAVPSLTTLLREGYTVVGVLTRADQPAGRGQKMAQSPVKRLAAAHGLPIQQPDTLRAREAFDALAALRPDVIVVAAYGLLLPQTVLDLPRFGCVNVHGSLLPRHRGAAPIAAAILAGDVVAGISVMLMDAGLDTGPVLSTASLPITPDDTTGTLTDRLAVLGAELLAQTLPGWMRGEVQPRPQPAEGASFAPRIAKEAGRIDWAEPAAMIARRVRAFLPWPGAYTTWNGMLLKVLRARAEAQPSDGHGVPGDVVAGRLRSAGVVTGDGILWLDEVQLAGKHALPTAAFLAGARDFVGSRLGS